MTPELQRLKEQALRVAAESPDPYKKVGCLGLNAYGAVIASGFNHAGKMQFKKSFWADRDKRRPFVVHAEIDMLSKCIGLNVNIHRLSQIIITLLPCEPCMNALAAFGVRVVYYLDFYDRDLGALDVARHHGIVCVQLK